MSASIAESKALFVRRWGEMAAYWGISRTMAEIHALLYVTVRPLCTDDIMAQLAVSRGNASMNLRALVDWGLIQRVHQRGDRKEYFTAVPDVWGMFESITRQRKRREVEPILETIERCRGLVGKEAASAKGEAAEEARQFRQRLDDMHGFLTAVGLVVDLMLRLGPKGLKRLNSMLVKLVA